MPLFDYVCVECGQETKDVLVSNWAAALNQKRECPLCGVMMARKTPAPAFSISGYRAANGYSGGK